MSEIVEEKLKNREQLILQQNKQLFLQKEVIDRLVTALNDIARYSENPFKGDKWDNERLLIAEEAIAFAKERLG